MHLRTDPSLQILKERYTSENGDVPKFEREAPEVCVLLLFPLWGKGAGNINTRHRVQLSPCGFTRTSLI